MNKKCRCFFKRFAALVAALVISFSLPVSALAAGDDTAPMPSYADFKAHPDSFYVWRTAIGNSNRYELIAGPMEVNGNTLIAESSAYHSYSNTLKSFDYASGDGSHTVYGCAIPAPIRFYYSTLDFLPSFRLDAFQAWYDCGLHFYPVDGQELSSVYVYIVPLFGSVDRQLIFSHSDSSSIDSFDAAFFDSPFLAYPFALRSYSNTSHSSYSIVGGTPLDDSYNYLSVLNLYNSYYFSGTSSLHPYPEGYTVSSSDIGVVFIKKPSGTYITDVSNYSVSVDGAFSFLVSKLILSGVKPGDWLSKADFDKLQDQLVKDFDINSDTLTNSKDNLNSWSSTSSVDSDIASGASGLLGGLFQNLGTFLFSVSLLCFGAVVLRMLIRKAVEG